MKKISKFILMSICLIGGATASITPLFLTSCSQNNNVSTSFRVVNMNLNTLDNPDASKININNLNNIVNVSPKDLIRGTNSFNNGKYIIIYGTIGYKLNGLTTTANQEAIHWDTSETSSFYKWLIGSTSNNGINPDEIDKFNSFDITNGFFNWWFNDTTYSQYKNVKIALFIDKPPYPQNNDELTADKYCPATPFEKWDETKLVQMYEFQSKQYDLEFSEIPQNWQLLKGSYIRNDESAKIYRELVNYSNQIRNGVQSVDESGDNTISGMIAFNGKGKNPITSSLPLNDYQKKSPIGMNLSSPPESWKKIYQFYTNEEWPVS